MDFEIPKMSIFRKSRLNFEVCAHNNLYFQDFLNAIALSTNNIFWSGKKHLVADTLLHQKQQKDLILIFSRSKTPLIKPLSTFFMYNGRGAPKPPLYMVYTSLIMVAVSLTSHDMIAVSLDTHSMFLRSPQFNEEGQGSLLPLSSPRDHVRHSPGILS